MQLQDNNIRQLKMLLALLRQSFKGSSFSGLKIDDAADSLEKAIKELEEK